MRIARPRERECGVAYWHLADKLRCLLFVRLRSEADIDRAPLTERRYEYASFSVASGSRCVSMARRRCNLARAAVSLLAQFGHLVLQPALSGDQFGAVLADDGARRAKRGSSNAWRLKPNSRRSAGASTSTRSRESYATRSCASENFTAKSLPTSLARR